MRVRIMGAESHRVFTRKRATLLSVQLSRSEVERPVMSRITVNVIAIRMLMTMTVDFLYVRVGGEKTV